ncbi:MAG: hypothetical protein ABSG89_07275 [Bacteroidales bacterium]|jgi:hypothetical protein
MNKKFLIISLLIIAACGGVFSQSPDNLYFKQPSILDTANSHKIMFRVEDINFFRNLEYFNPIAEGHTYIGFILRPSFSYQPTANTCLQVGIHLLKYSGNNDFAQTLPFFRFQYRILPNFDLILGSLYSTLNHGMIEPIYGFDRYIEDNVENGMQFLYHNPHFKADLWLNWQNFIKFDDTQKEQFSVGYSSEVILTDQSKPLKLSIPVQFLFAHRGGQNTLDTARMFTRFNGAVGFSSEYTFDRRFVKRIGAYAYYLIYKDIITPHDIAYSYGNATYANIYLNTSFINFTVGEWTGFQFFNPRGERLFSNISTIDDPDRLGTPTPGQYIIPQRNLFLSKVFFHHNICKGIDLCAAFESFYDYKNSIFDYNYDLYVICNMDFFIHKVFHTD